MPQTQQFTAQDMSIEAQTVGYDGFYRLDIFRIEHAAYQGGTVRIERELMIRPHAAVVLLYDPTRREVVLVEQFRVGAFERSSPWLIECVAGLIDEAASPEAVARREAVEETGAQVGRMHFICEYFPSPGGSNERVSLWIGEVDASTASGVHGLVNEGENILVHRISVTEALHWLQQGLIDNAAGIIALQWLALHEPWLREQWHGEPAA